MNALRQSSSTLTWAGYLLGFALGGFFDGILLHQILQWHHLLSGVAAISELRVQVLADGLFHLLMYLVAAIGLAMLWRARDAFAGPAAGRYMAGCLFIGFGVWHVVDTLLSHWLLGIHRIRMDTEYRLAYDLAWVIVFGGFALAIGAWLRHGNEIQPPGSGRRAAPLVLALLVVTAGAVAARSPSGSDTSTALFAQPVTMAEMAAMLDGAGGRVLWSDAGGELWVVSAPGSVALRLYRGGAIAVSGAGSPFACLAWLRRA